MILHVLAGLDVSALSGKIRAMRSDRQTSEQRNQCLVASLHPSADHYACRAFVWLAFDGDVVGQAVGARGDLLVAPVDQLIGLRRGRGRSCGFGDGRSGPAPIWILCSAIVGHLSVSHLPNRHGSDYCEVWCVVSDSTQSEGPKAL